MKLTFHEERIKTENPDANLWRAVIDQAIEDLSQPRLRQAAVNWFASTARGPGSFRWACDHLDLNPSAVWAALNKANDLGKTSATLGTSFQHRSLNQTAGDLLRLRAISAARLNEAEEMGTPNPDGTLKIERTTTGKVALTIVVTHSQK
jgi:hypothetical protein